MLASGGLDSSVLLADLAHAGPFVGLEKSDVIRKGRALPLHLTLYARTREDRFIAEHAPSAPSASRVFTPRVFPIRPTMPAIEAGYRDYTFSPGVLLNLIFASFARPFSMPFKMYSWLKSSSTIAIFAFAELRGA